MTGDAPAPLVAPYLWQEPPWGDHYVAVSTRDYEATCKTVEAFFGRELTRYSYCLIHEAKRYAVFSFPHRDDADLYLLQFEGEAFDPCDKGRGRNWMKWYKGRTAKRERNRSPYDFGTRG